MKSLDDEIIEALERLGDLQKDNARLRDLVAQYQQGKVSDLYRKHGG